VYLFVHKTTGDRFHRDQLRVTIRKNRLSTAHYDAQTNNAAKKIRHFQQQ